MSGFLRVKQLNSFQLWASMFYDHVGSFTTVQGGMADETPAHYSSLENSCNLVEPRNCGESYRIRHFEKLKLQGKTLTNLQNERCTPLRLNQLNTIIIIIHTGLR